MRCPFCGKDDTQSKKILGQVTMVAQLEEEDYALAVAQDLQLSKEFN